MQNSSTKSKKVLLGVLALVVLVAILGGVYWSTRPDTVSGDKVIEVTVITEAGQSEVHVIETTEEYLGDALLESGLIDGSMGEFGLFITTVDGITADDSLQQWWAVTKEGTFLETGADTTPISDGDGFEFTLTTGYE